MFIVFENNPQLFSVADSIKIFNDPDQAARYAINRGLSNVLTPTVDALKAAVGQPGKSITGGQTGFSVTLFNADPVDGAANAVPSEALQKLVDELGKQKVQLEGELVVAKDQLTTAVDAVSVMLEKSEKANEALKARVAELEKAAEAPLAVTRTVLASDAEAPAPAPTAKKKASESK